MDAPNLSSRRAFLKGAPVAAMAITLPAVALASQPSTASAELLALIGAYEATGTAADAAKAAWQNARMRLRTDLAAAELSIRLGHEFHHDRIDLDHELTPDWVRDYMIRKRYDERVGSMRRSKARQPELAPWLGNIPRVKAARDQVLDAAEPVLVQFAAIIEASGVDAAELAYSTADDAARQASKALLAYRPETMAETRAIAAAMWRRGKATGQWHEMPALAFIEALCPELVGLAYA